MHVRRIGIEPKYSDYIVDFQSEQMEQVDTVTFGWGNTTDNGGSISKVSPNRWLGIVQFDGVHSAGKPGELYYMRAHKKPEGDG